MHTIKTCQICNTNSFKSFLTCTDFTVSKEEFQIDSCSNCGFKFTNPIPELSNLGNYYKSDDYISHSNTSKGFINSVYQLVRKYTLIKKLQLVNQITKHSDYKHLLDIGCGTGEFLNTCYKAGWKAQGIEPDEKARKSAQRKYNLTVNEESFLNNAFDESFDCVTMWHVLEHVQDLNERISAIRKILTANGKLVVAVPNCSSYDAIHYGKYWGAYDVPRHLHHFTPRDIETLFAKHNMAIERVLPMVFDSFYVSMLSEKYKHGKSRVLAGFIQGLISNIKAASKNNQTYSSQIYIIKKK